MPLPRLDSDVLFLILEAVSADIPDRDPYRAHKSRVGEPYQTYYQCCLASRELCQLARPLLYRHVLLDFRLPFILRVPDALPTVSTNPGLARLVRKVTLREIGDSADELWDDYEDEQVILQEDSARASGLFGACSSVSHLVIEDFYRTDVLINIMSHARRAAAEITRLDIFERKRSLNDTLSPERCIEYLTSFPNLSHARLYVRVDRDDDFDSAVGTLKDKRNVPRIELRNLELGNDWAVLLLPLIGSNFAGTLTNLQLPLHEHSVQPDLTPFINLVRLGLQRGSGKTETFTNNLNAVLYQLHSLPKLKILDLSPHPSLSHYDEVNIDFSAVPNTLRSLSLGFRFGLASFESWLAAMPPQAEMPRIELKLLLHFYDPHPREEQLFMVLNAVKTVRRNRGQVEERGERVTRFLHHFGGESSSVVLNLW